MSFFGWWYPPYHIPSGTQTWLADHPPKDDLLDFSSYKPPCLMEVSMIFPSPALPPSARTSHWVRSESPRHHHPGRRWQHCLAPGVPPDTRVDVRDLGAVYYYSKGKGLATRETVGFWENDEKPLELEAPSFNQSNKKDQDSWFNHLPIWRIGLRLHWWLTIKNQMKQWDSTAQRWPTNNSS